MSDTVNAPAEPTPAASSADPSGRPETPPPAPPPAPPQPAVAAPPQQHHYVPVPTDPRRKSPFLAGLLSLVPGLGQVYTGYYQRGFVHAFVIAGTITLLASGDMDALVPLAALFLVFFWLYNVVDAARRASLYNQVLDGVADVELPEDWKTPGFRGSIVGGLVIAAFGVVLLLETRYDITLEWLEEWWPVGIIAFGLYLVYKAIEDRRKRERAAAD